MSDVRFGLWLKTRRVICDELDRMASESTDKAPYPESGLLEVFKYCVESEEIQLRGHSERYWEKLDEADERNRREREK
jgi:hypothetical protein